MLLTDFVPPVSAGGTCLSRGHPKRARLVGSALELRTHIPTHQVSRTGSICLRRTGSSARRLTTFRTWTEAGPGTGRWRGVTCSRVLVGVDRELFLDLGPCNRQSGLECEAIIDLRRRLALQDP